MKLAARIRRIAGPAAGSLGVLAALASGTAAQPTQVFALKIDDNIPGVGNVTRLGAAVVNSAGSWVLYAKTDQASSLTDQVLMRDGALLLREGDPLAAPAGATVDGFGPFDLDDNGNLLEILFLSGTSGLGDDTGLYLNGNLLLQEGGPAAGFGPGTIYRGFLNVKTNGAGTHAALVVCVDDPAVPGTLEPAVVRLDLSGGAITGQTVIARQGDVLAGQTRPLVGIGTGAHQLAINDAGDILFFADLAGDPATDGAIYLDGTLLAQEGSVSPDSVSNYEHLASRALDLNDAGSYAFQADLDGATATDAVIVQDGAVHVREGDRPFPSPLSNRAIQDFGSPDTPVRVDASGAVTWAGHVRPLFSVISAADTLSTYGPSGPAVEGNQVREVRTGSDSFSASRMNGYLLYYALTGSNTGSVDGYVILSLTSTFPVDAPAVAAAGPSLSVFPNPSRGAVQVRFALERSAPVSLRVFDVRGRLVRTLTEGVRPSGDQAVDWNGTSSDGRRVAPGTYFLRLRAGDRERTARVTLVE